MNPTDKESAAVPPEISSGRSLSHAAPANPTPAPVGRGPVILLACAGIACVTLAGATLVSRQREGAALENDTRDNSVAIVNVIHPKRTPAQVEIVLPGNITAFEEAPIYARVNGYLKHWTTDIGTRVETGQRLAEIETPELDQELNQARAALAQANANLEIARISSERWQNLRKSDAVSQQDTDVKVATWHAREADVKAAEANVQRLNELINFKQLVAPFSGIITVRAVDTGTLITAGSGREIFRLARIDPLRVYLSLPQAYSQMVKPGDEAVLELDELPGRKFTGKVIRTSGSIDPVSRTLLTEVQVSNHDGKLFPGAHAMVRIKLQDGEKPVVVPVNTLLFRNEQGMQVGVVASNGVVRLANVTVGRDYGTTVEIVHGLSETDDVIVNPSDSIEAGLQVKVVPLETGKPEVEKAAPVHE